MSVASGGRNIVAARDQNEMCVTVRMDWDICGRGICDTMGECDAIQHPSQPEMAKENVIGQAQASLTSVTLSCRTQAGPNVCSIVVTYGKSRAAPLLNSVLRRRFAEKKVGFSPDRRPTFP